jgi:molybdenum cofactor cytidylyltransferase
VAHAARLGYPAVAGEPVRPGVSSLIAAIVLAGGLSRRMGRPKLLLDMRGRPVIRRTVDALLAHVADLVVVTGTEDAALRAALPGLPVRFVNNPRPQDGQGSSLAVGVRALKPWTRAALVALGDQPRLPDSVIPALLEAFARTGGPVVVPIYHGGVQGNPVLFGDEVFGELATLTGDLGGKPVVQARPERVVRVRFDLPMPADIDTPEDYARLHVE